MNNRDIENIIKLQSYIRGFLVRNRKTKDKMSLVLVDKLLENYNKNILLNQEINSVLSLKKIRNYNFPSEISENIAKYAICHKYGIMPNWDTKSGDLILFNKKIEVKGFTSIGPSSFGPNENWDILCFVDATQHKTKYFKIYMIFLSNKNPMWYNIKVNSKETYLDHCNQKRRPRIKFTDIYKQLPSHYCNLG